MDIKDYLKNIPNSVSGDGQTFAMKLKMILRDIVSYIDSNVEEKLDQLGDGAAASVTGLRLTEQHTTDSNGMPQNNILVEYDNTNVENFLHCQIWVKPSEEDSVYAQHGTASGLKYIIEGVKAGETYIVKAVSVNKQGGTSAFNDSPTASITIKGSVLIPDAPKQFILTWDKYGPLWEWLQDDNGYIDFFELRLDAKAGEYSDKLLERTRNMWSRANPNVRSGTAYLFTRNIFGTYSQPATFNFTKAVGSKPSAPTMVNVLKGVQITMDPLPTGFTHYTVIVNGEDYISYNNVFVYFQYSGQITVKYCFADDISDGEYSNVVTADVQSLVRTEDIAENAVTAELIAANAVTAAKIAANAVTANKIATNAVTADKIAAGAIHVGGANGNVTIENGAINGDMIQAGSIIGQHISAGAVTAEKIAAGSVTAEKIAAGAIQVGGASGNVSIQDGAIDAVKLNVTTLSTITAKIGELKTADSGARTVIKDNLIEVYDSNNVLRVRMGVW